MDEYLDIGESVIVQAADDAKQSSDMQLRKQAWRWLQSTSEAPRTFCWYCNQLAIHPDDAYRLVTRYINDATHR